MDRPYEINRSNSYLKAFSNEIIFFILCIRKFGRSFFYELFIPYDIIQYIIIYFIKCKLYSNIHISCGGKRSMIVKDNRLIRCYCNNHELYMKDCCHLIARSCFHFNKDDILLSSIEETRAFIVTTQGLKEYNTKGGSPLGWIKKDFKYKIISMSSCLYHTLFQTTEGLFIDSVDNGQRLYLPYNNNNMIPLPKVILISCKFETSLALTIDGLYAFGNNTYCQLGIYEESVYYIHSFRKISIHNVISIACGGQHTLILTSKGLYGCGISHNFDGIPNFFTYGNLTGCCNTPQKLKISNVISMSCGENHSLILTSDGSLYGCGQDTWGQTGLEYNPFIPNRIMRKIKLNNIIAFACERDYSIIVTEEGLFSCGRNDELCYIYQTNEKYNELRFINKI